MVRVRLIGELAIELDGKDLPPPPGRPARALLAWLALHPGMHPRSRLAARLWPEVLDESARGSLRNALAALRRALAEADAQLVVATREQVGLCSVPDVWVDVRAFEALAAAGKLEEALALSRGELLPDLDDDWAHEARADHRHRVILALARLADAEERQGQLDRAIARSHELVSLDPLSEEAQRSLIRRLAAAGDRAGALATYNRFANRVRRELGLLPSQETRSLIERLRGEDAAHPARAHVERPAVPAALARRPQSALVGRRAELERLGAAWERARTGERRLALIAGEPGIGKTRLAAELAHATHAAGGAVLHGRAYEDPLVAYQPFVEALRPYLTPASVENADLVPLLPGHGEEVPQGPRSADPQGARFALFEAVGSLLASLARRWPLLLVLEDLHWADKATLLLLAHVVRQPGPARLLLVGTYRERELAREHPLTAMLAELRRERFGERLRLEGLDEIGVGALVEDRIGAAASLELARAVQRRTEGNPFFVEELLRDLAETGALDHPSPHAVEQVGVPEGVQEVIGHRLARLGDEAVQVLLLASVVGREFELRPLEELLEGMDRERVLGALERAVSAGLVREEPGRVGRYSFAHGLVRETLYTGLTATRRARFHGRVAEVFERLFGGAPDRLGELAHHLLEAAEPDAVQRAAEYATRAGEVALAQLAYEEAAAHFEKALEALELDLRPHGLGRLELLLALGDARLRAGESVEGRRALAKAAAAARALHRADLLARAALGFGGIGVTIAAPDQAVVRLLKEALGALSDTDDQLRARLLARLAIELYYAPQRTRTETLSAQAVELARRTGHDPTLVETLNARHVALWRPDHLEERLAIATEMVRIAERTGDAVGLVQARNWRILDLFEVGDRPALRRELDAYGRLAAELRLPAYTWYEPLWQATLAILEGRLQDAGRLASQARELGRGTPNAELFYRIQTEHLQLEEGQPAPVLETLQELIGSSPAGVAHRSGLPLLLAMLGRRPEAQAELDELGAGGFSVFVKDANWLPAHAILAEAAALLDDHVHAAELYALLLPYSGRNVIDGRATYCYGSTDHYLGLVATATSRWTDALGHFEEALAFHRSLCAGPLVCHTLRAHAAALLGRGEPGDRERAHALAREALERARDLGIQRLIDEAVAVEARARLRT